MEDFNKLCGWIDDPIEIQKVRSRENFKDLSFYNAIKDTGQGKIALLHKIYEQVTSKDFPVWDQGIGDCVSFGYALGISTLKAVQIANGSGEKYIADVATEPIYGGSRVEIGGGRLGCKSDGSLGAWGAKWIKDYGVLLRKNYNEDNLSAYSSFKAKNWGCYGVPDNLEVIAKEHPVQTVALVQTYDEARDAIANGYPVVVCSSRGFETKRDNDGFAKPLGTWNHCMCFVAVDDQHTRPGLLCCNSWGRDYIFGPKRHGQPDGSFWVDGNVADKMLARGDSYAISSLKGFGVNDMYTLMRSLNIV